MHADWIRGACLSPDGVLVATCGLDGVVRVCNTTDGAIVAEWDDHERIGGAKHVAFTPDGRFLASAAMDGAVLVKRFEHSESKAGF